MIIASALLFTIGVVGATQVRFLFGLPFAMLFLALACLGLQRLPPAIGMASLGYTLWGALTQIAATALMLAAMRERSFAVTTAYTKTEPVQVALFGALLLGDALTPLKFLAIAIATAGVIVVSAARGEDDDDGDDRDHDRDAEEGEALCATHGSRG